MTPQENMIEKYGEAFACFVMGMLQGRGDAKREDVRYLPIPTYMIRGFPPIRHLACHTRYGYTSALITWLCKNPEYPIERPRRGYIRMVAS